MWFRLCNFIEDTRDAYLEVVIFERLYRVVALKFAKHGNGKKVILLGVVGNIRLN